MIIINSGSKPKAQELLLKASKRFIKAYKVKMPRPIEIKSSYVAYEFTDLKCNIRVSSFEGWFECSINSIGEILIPYLIPLPLGCEDEEKIQLIISCLECWVNNTFSVHP